MSIGQLMTVEDIAAMLQYSVPHVRDRLVRRPGFPAPALSERRGRRWRREAIERWVLEQEKLSNRGHAA